MLQIFSYSNPVRGVPDFFSGSVHSKALCQFKSHFFRPVKLSWKSWAEVISTAAEVHYLKSYGEIFRTMDILRWMDNISSSLK